jgi:hypothetical protein
MEGAGADVLEKGVGVVPAGGAIAAARPSATVLEPGGAGTGGGRNVKGRSAANPRQQTVFLLGFGRNVCTTSYN